MKTPEQSRTWLLRENAELRARLEEAEETLSAIRTGEVDALVVGEHIYSLNGAETPYRVLMEAMEEGAATLGEDGTVLYCNRRLAELLRTPLEAVIGSPLRRFLSADDVTAFDALWARGRHAPVKRELNLQSQGAGPLPVLLSLNVLEVLGTRAVCAVATDLTERNRAEASRVEEQARLNAELTRAHRATLNLMQDAVAAKARLEKSNQDLRLENTQRRQAEEHAQSEKLLSDSLINSLPGIVFLFDERGKSLRWNANLERVTGYSASELAAVSPLDFFDGGERAVVQQNIRAVFADGQADTEAHLVSKSGRRTPYFLTGRRVELNGRPCLLGVGLDLSERYRTEERIRRQAALLDAANDAIFLRTLDGTVTYWNAGAERLYGWTRAEALGRKSTELSPRLDLAAYEVAHASLLQRGIWSGELELANREGRALTVFCRWTLLRDAQGQPSEVLAINIDITERKQLEANFFRAQRLDSIGSLAAGIAHDLNNILAPILIGASMLRETTGDPASRQMLDAMAGSAKRGADIIRQLLTFARGQPGTKVHLPVRHVLNEMATIIRETFPKNITIGISVPKDLWSVLADATQFHQALMNLCVNGRDAMSAGGALTLSAENLTLSEEAAAPLADAKPGTYVCVSVTDTGTGIAPENLGRIFDPFFTTKEIGKGTGLGLASVLGIVRGHGGFVRVHSQLGAGTTFQLHFPSVPAAAKTGPMAAGAELRRGHGETVLVVDDEVSVRETIQQILETMGYRSLGAGEGQAALALLARHRAEIKVVLLDMMMPGMDGPTLVQALRQQKVSLPIIGMSGLASREDIKKLKQLELSCMLAKPFEPAPLLEAIHRALTAAVRNPHAGRYDPT